MTTIGLQPGANIEMQTNETAPIGTNALGFSGPPSTPAIGIGAGRGDGYVGDGRHDAGLDRTQRIDGSFERGARDDQIAAH